MKKETTKAAKNLKKSAASKLTKAKRKGGMSKMAAPAAGAVIGAALGTAAGSIFTNKDAKKTISGIGGTLSEYTSDALDVISENKEKIDVIAKDSIKKAKKKITN